MMIGQRPARGFDPYMPQPMIERPTMLDAPPIAVPQAPAKPKINWMGILADALSGAAGQPGQYAASMREQRREQSALERGEQQYQRRRLDDQTDWMARQQYENANRRPTGFGAELAEAGYVPGTPEYNQRMQTRIANQLDPIVNMNTPSGYYMGPRSGMTSSGTSSNNAKPTPPPQAIEELRRNPGAASQFDEIFGQGASYRALGGQSQPATGGFPDPLAPY